MIITNQVMRNFERLFLELSAYVRLLEVVKALSECERQAATSMRIVREPDGAELAQLAHIPFDEAMRQAILSRQLKRLDEQRNKLEHLGFDPAKIAGWNGKPC